MFIVVIAVCSLLIVATLRYYWMTSFRLSALPLPVSLLLGYVLWQIYLPGFFKAVDPTFLRASVALFTYFAVHALFRRRMDQIRDVVGKIDEEDVDLRAASEVFVSYKSRNAQVARMIAELLLSNGVGTWFAEYRIHYAEWFDDGLVNKKIADGISKSTSAVCILDEEYFGSPYCRSELEGLLDDDDCEVQLLSFSDTLESLPGFSDFNAAHDLPDAVALADRSGAVRDYLMVAPSPLRIFNSLNPAPSFPKEKPVEFAYQTQKYSLDVSSWEVDSRLYSDDSGNEGPRFFKGIDGTVVQAKLIVGTGPLFTHENVPDELSPEFISSLREKFPNSTLIDQLGCDAKDKDRMLYRLWAIFSEDYFTNVYEQELIGLHLFFHNGRSHLATTTRIGGRYCRRYSIVEHSPSLGQDLEFAFTFDVRSDFRSLCKVGWILDQTVSSIQLH